MEKKEYRQLLSQRQYIRLLLADTINRFGDSIDVIAYSWIMYEITGSASLMALVVGLNFVPTVFLTPFAGAFVDRISKKRVMALADLLRFVFVAAIVTLYTTGLLSPALIVVFTLATSTVEAFRLPAGGAILPQLLEKEYYTLGKAASYSSSRISELAGYMLAGGVIALLGAAGALWIDAATFLISSAIIWSIRYQENLQGAKQTVKGVIQDFAEGFRFIRASRTIRTVSLMGLLINFGIMPLTVFQTPYVSDYLKMGPETLSYIKILMSVGMMTGAALLPKLGKIKTPAIVVAAGVIMGAALIEMSIAQSLSSPVLKMGILTLSMLSIGFGGGLLNVVIGSSVMKAVPKEMMGRISGFLAALMQASMPVASFICSALAVYFHIPHTPTTYNVTVNNDGNGTASATPSAAEALTEITLTAKPDEGYRFKEWEVISGGVSIKDDKFTMPSANVEVKAIFEKDAPTEFTITFDGNGGTPSVDSMTTTNQKLTSLPSASRSGSYSFDGWYTKKNGGTEITTDTEFPADTTVYAHWTYTGGGGSSGYSYYTIKATAGTGGSISPSGNVSVREGRDQTFTITPDKGYAVANVKIDGKSIGAVKSYTFENVRRTHTIEVIFMKANGNPQTGVFVDVATGSYYEDAVDWAVENGITKGTDDTHFSPDGICTRAQAVTFLWRTAGSPKPETRTMPFTDVPVGSYYYDAVLWAVENGITKGTSDTTFSPNMTCSRAQIVTFLWRSEKSPAAGTANPFADVKSTAYYADAVLWAVKENITKGTTNTTFSPNADCTRAQIVTFLWRCKK